LITAARVRLGVYVTGAWLATIACGNSGTSEVKAASPASEPGREHAGAPGQTDPGPQRGPEHTVFSLLDNRLLAHSVSNGGVLLRASSAGMVKYVNVRDGQLPFALQQERDGRKVARMRGTTASLWVPLDDGSAGAGQHVRLSHYSPQARRLTIRVNGTDIGTVDVPAGWGTSEVPISDGLLKAPGENEILLFASRGEPLELEWLQLAGSAAPSATRPLYDPGRAALVVGKGDALVYHVMVPPRARLVATVLDGCEVAVAARPQRGKAVFGILAGRDRAVDLGALAGSVVRLELRGQTCPVAYLPQAELAVAGPAPTVSRGPKPRFAVFWIMDSLRADRVKPFVAGARPEVPTFENLARTSAVFVQAYVQGNESRVSHASMWSSLYPIKHDMLAAKAKLDPKWVTLDEVMRQAGMYTAGESANGYITARWGFGTEWDAYRNHIHEGGGLSGEDILSRGLAAVDKLDKPWFLYLGTIDTHVSWRAKEPWMSRYDPEPYNGRFERIASGADMGKVAAGKLKVTDRDIKRIRAIYDSNVSYQDDLLRQLLERLDALGIRDQTMVVITSDHGDEQWEDGRVGHGGSLRESLVHVPLLIHYPPLFPGRRVEEGAEVVDILPTLADALGVEADDEWQGESLIPIANGVRAGYPRMSMASQYERAHAARIGPWKVRVAGAGPASLYKLDDDPGEANNLAGKEPFARRFVEDPLRLLRAYNLRWKKSRWGNPANATAHLPSDLGE
jgi:arylsulfatase A-like enzyme